MAMEMQAPAVSADLIYPPGDLAFTCDAELISEAMKRLREVGDEAGYLYIEARTPDMSQVSEHGSVLLALGGPSGVAFAEFPAHVESAGYALLDNPRRLSSYAQRLVGQEIRVTHRMEDGLRVLTVEEPAGRVNLEIMIYYDDETIGEIFPLRRMRRYSLPYGAESGQVDRSAQLMQRFASASGTGAQLVIGTAGHPAVAVRAALQDGTFVHASMPLESGLLARLAAEGTLYVPSKLLRLVLRLESSANRLRYDLSTQDGIVTLDLEAIEPLGHGMLLYLQYVQQLVLQTDPIITWDPSQLTIEHWVTVSSAQLDSAIGRIGAVYESTLKLERTGGQLRVVPGRDQTSYVAIDAEEGPSPSHFVLLSSHAAQALQAALLLVGGEQVALYTIRAGNAESGLILQGERPGARVMIVMV